MMKMNIYATLVLIALGIAGAVPMLKSGLGISTWVAILIAVPLVPSMVFALRPQMGYSPDADRALDRFIKELEVELVVGHQGISGVAGVWGYGWPKVLILFASTDALQAAQAAGLSISWQADSPLK